MVAALAPLELLERTRRGEAVDDASIAGFIESWLDGSSTLDTFGAGGGGGAGGATVVVAPVVVRVGAATASPGTSAARIASAGTFRDNAIAAER